jgi:hypothetical protein
MSGTPMQGWVCQQQLLGESCMLDDSKGVFLVDLIMQMDLNLVEGQEALLGTAPVVAVELGLAQ